MGNRLWWIGGALFLAIGISAGVYLYATYAMKGRVAGFIAAIGEIGYVRGGRVPDSPAFRREVERLAVENDVMLDSLVIVRDEGEGLDTAGRLANEKLGRARVGAVELASAAFRMNVVRFRIRARARTTMWMFSDVHEVETERSFRAGAAISPEIAPVREMPERESEGSRGL
jgi:hypothetical protein